MSFVKDDPLAAENRRISIIVLNNKTQLAIETANATGHASNAEPEPEPMTKVNRSVAVEKSADANGVTDALTAAVPTTSVNEKPAP